MPEENKEPTIGSLVEIIRPGRDKGRRGIITGHPITKRDVITSDELILYLEINGKWLDCRWVTVEDVEVKQQDYADVTDRWSFQVKEVAEVEPNESKPVKTRKSRRTTKSD
jgi:hypothetical protein